MGPLWGKMKNVPARAEPKASLSRRNPYPGGDPSGRDGKGPPSGQGPRWGKVQSEERKKRGANGLTADR